MAELEKILCTDSRIEAAKKINAIVDAMGEGDLANIDLSNLSSAGQAKFDERAYANEVLKKNQLTNCLLEVPQNIKLELNNGTLTLKAGSKVIVPNGFEANGTTPKFDEIVVTKDLSVGASSLSTAERGIVLINGDIVLIHWASNKSGTSPTTQGFYYHTGENKFYRDGVAQTNFSFPIMVGNYTTQYGFNDITQVFNGMGYFGSTMWVDKGVKLLVANGINDDGTIKNEEIVTPNVIVARGSVPGTRSDCIPFLRKYPTSNQLQIYPIAKANFLGELDYVPTVGASFQWYFNTSEMKWYMHEAGATEWVNTPYYNISPTISVVNNVITSFEPYKPFRAVDYNDALLKSDKSEIVSWGMPDYSAGISVDITTSDKSFTAPCDGLYVTMPYTDGVNYLIVNGVATVYGYQDSSTGEHVEGVTIPLGKNDVIKWQNNLYSSKAYYSTFFPLKGAN